MQGALVVRMRFPRVEDFRLRYSRDISRGGVFIQTQQPKPLGSNVVLVLELATSSETVSLAGEVVTSIGPEEAAARGVNPGMGIRFVDLDEPKRRSIEAILGQGAAVKPAAKAAPPAAPKPVAKPAPAAAAPSDVDVAKLFREARALLAAMGAQDCYEVLGVARDATTGEIRRSFLKLTRRYHPDNYFRRVPKEVSESLEDIYDRLTQAYETLSNRDSRIAYDLSIGHLGGNRDGISGDEMTRVAAEKRRREEAPGRVSRGEQLFAQAMLELSSGQKAKAVANLRLALAFDPENAQIQGKLRELTQKS